MRQIIQFDTHDLNGLFNYMLQPVLDTYCSFSFIFRSGKFSKHLFSTFVYLTTPCTLVKITTVSLTPSVISYSFAVIFGHLLFPYLIVLFPHFYTFLGAFFSFSPLFFHLPSFSLPDVVLRAVYLTGDAPPQHPMTLFLKLSFLSTFWFFSAIYL